MLSLVSLRALFWAPYCSYVTLMTYQTPSKVKLEYITDDTLVYNCINKIDDCIQLQRDLAELKKWAKVCQMEFNPLKCELLTITNQRSPLKFIYHINDVPIKEADFVKYLGVMIDSKLTWKEHIKQVLSKSNASLAFLQRNLRACSRNIKEYCYKTSIRPIIEYATNILGSTYYSRYKQNRNASKKSDSFCLQQIQ